jgi:hypothetical protein
MHQLKLLNTRPIMTFECPCGFSEPNIQRDEACYHGWLTPLNMSEHEQDGKTIIALCRRCTNRPIFETQSKWRFGPAPGELTYEWLRRQSRIDGKPYTRPVTVPLPGGTIVIARKTITLIDGTCVEAGTPGWTHESEGNRTAVYFKGMSMRPPYPLVNWSDLLC